MTSQPKIPEGHQAVMPYLMVKEPEALFEFLQKAFGATQKIKVMNKDGTNVMHAEATIDGHCVMYGYPDTFPEQPSGLSIAVPNVDEIYKKGIEAGATSILEPCNPGWTGRFAGFKDQFGNTWWISEPQKAEVKKEQPALTPYFAPKDAAALLEFLKKVFNAEEKDRKYHPGSEKVMHAETLVSGNTIMVSTGSDEWAYLSGGASVAVPDVDEVYKKALAEGATSIVEPVDFPWGRFSGWKDPFGSTWWVTSQQADATENVNPYISPKDCAGFMDFVKKTFNAEEKTKSLTPEGIVSHGELRVLGTVLMCAEGSAEKGYITGGLAVRTQDIDGVYQRAIAAGATSKTEPQDMPWGRFCTFQDSFGNTWLINSAGKEEKKDLTQGQGVWSNLALKNAAGFLDFVKKVFHAEDKFRHLSEDGKSVMHAETLISGGTIMCSEGSEQMGYRNGGIFVYVPSVDETHKAALAEGGTEVMAPCNMSDGRGSGFKDPFGNTFWLASSKNENEEILGKRNGTENAADNLEPDVEKKIKQ